MPTNMDHLAILNNAASLARLSRDEHQAVANAVNALQQFITENEAADNTDCPPE